MKRFDAGEAADPADDFPSGVSIGSGRLADRLTRLPATDSLSDLFSAVAADRGDAIAVADDRRVLTYQDLALAAETVAGHLRADCRVRPGDLVTLQLPPSADLVVAILGILRCGAAYVPLDPQSPPARHELIVGDACPSAAIGDAAHPAAAARITAADLASLIDGPAGHSPDLADRDGLAYVIYTSGTTGRPKGVPVAHRNVRALLAATAPLFDFGPDDTWLMYHSAAFDFSVWETWGALAYGGRLMIPGAWTRINPKACADLLVTEGVTVLNQTPTAFGVLSRAILELTDPLPLRYVIFGGERLAPSLLRPWAAAYGVDRPRLINMYGLTEATVHATYHRITSADLGREVSVVGRALPGLTVRIVDQDGAETTRGELTVAGPQVAGGYLRQPELTGTRFVRQPDGTVYYQTGDLVEVSADGDLTYLGRADRQVKVRGHRIEIGEIESAVGAVPGIAEAVVLAGDADGQPALHCFYTTHDGAPLEVRVLRRQLFARLPRYMMPTRFTWRPGLPLTPNGKTDHDALRRDGNR